jgi:hypothetical protein
MAIGIAILLDPSRVLDLFSDIFLDGRAAPAAYDSFTYDPEFLRLRGPFLLALLIANALLYASVGGRGRWTATTRRLDFAAQVALTAVMAWVALDGRVLVGDASDAGVKGILSLMVVLMLVGLVKRIVRERARLRPLEALLGRPAS